MTTVLFEMHKLEGSLDAKGINSSEFDLKSKYFNSILEKYGITEAQFDSSVVWYAKNPKKYEDIYTDVLAQLTDLQNDVKKGKYHPVDSIELRKIKLNLWIKKSKYVFTKDSVRSHLDFKIADKDFLYGDVYVLKFKQLIAPEDSSKNQRIVLRINYWNGKTDSVSRKAYNDSLTRRYTFRFPATEKLKIKSISGELLASTRYKGVFHATIDSISLLRVYDPKLQDSLRAIVQKADPTKYFTPKEHRLDSIKKAKLDSVKKVPKNQSKTPEK